MLERGRFMSNFVPFLFLFLDLLILFQIHLKIVLFQIYLKEGFLSSYYKFNFPGSKL